MRETPVKERRVVISAASDGDLVTISVADKGSGVTDDTAEKLFSPFFSTKTEGMGMGLNICRSIIEFHQGRLWFEPNQGGGSVFKFTLHRSAS
jgi:two-component system, LuxR family, sensor histidine kinase DctS